MRIIAGQLRGRKLASPPGRGTRPLLDRVREALFSTLGPGIVDSYVLDLFAGSGSLGLEALSRGAAFARLVEADRQVITTLTDGGTVHATADDGATWFVPEGLPDTINETRRIIRDPGHIEARRELRLMNSRGQTKKKGVFSSLIGKK